MLPHSLIRNLLREHGRLQTEALRRLSEQELFRAVGRNEIKDTLNAMVEQQQITRAKKGNGFVFAISGLWENDMPHQPCIHCNEQSWYGEGHVTGGPYAPEQKAIPADPDGMNAKRSHWAAKAITAFRRATGSSQGGEAVGDLLADLMHYADRHGISFADCLRTAEHHYISETTPKRPVTG